jgi:hypothetical protein
MTARNAKLAATFVFCVLTATTLVGRASDTTSSGVVKTTSVGVPPKDEHALALLSNGMRYLNPDSGVVDPLSGYPFEGWNHEPEKLLDLRTFTQITAIGKYMEVLADVAAGQIEDPTVSRQSALTKLAAVTETLRLDQRDPTLACNGLLANFIGLKVGKRLGTLASTLDRELVVRTFGPDKGTELWAALISRGWLVVGGQPGEARINRDKQYGWNYFDGALSNFSDDDTRKQVMSLLDRRELELSFGDNANLSTSVAMAIGALLTPSIASQPEVVKIRQQLEEFLAAQTHGYAELYDHKVGLCYFGKDAVRNRLIGWSDDKGAWRPGYNDYFVNEYRGPSTFVTARFGLPLGAVGNLGFKMKPYTKADGTTLYVLASWDGSGFQSFGLGLSLKEKESPSWSELLKNAAAVHVDFSTSQKLPAFLSECFTGNANQYSGAVGIPKISVMQGGRLTDAASLYSIGTAYSLAPEEIERFLGANWSALAPLLTDHGPWEGFNTSWGQPIRIQTTAHTLSLVVGLVGTGPANMRRYAEHAGLSDRIAEHFRPGGVSEFMGRDTQIFAWGDKGGKTASQRQKNSFSVSGQGVRTLGLAFVASNDEGRNISGCRLNLRYRSSERLDDVVIALKTAGGNKPFLVPKEIIASFAKTDGEESQLEVPLPAMVGLNNIKEVVISHESKTPSNVDLSITGLTFTPITRH